MNEREQELRVALGVEAGTMDAEDQSEHGRHAEGR